MGAIRLDETLDAAPGCEPCSGLRIVRLPGMDATNTGEPVFELGCHKHGLGMRTTGSRLTA